MTTISDELRQLIVGSQARVLTNVPHPASIKEVEVEARTKWHKSVLKNDTDLLNDEPIPVVEGRIVEITKLDEFGEPIGKATFALEHKYGHPQRKSNDVSVTKLSTSTLRGIKVRFPTMVEEFEANMLKTGRDLPLCFLDNVPGEVLQIVQTKGVDSVRAFAEWTDKKLADLVKDLEFNDMNARAHYVKEYRGRAREKCSYAEQKAA